MTEADAVDLEPLADILAGRLGSFGFLYARNRVIAYSVALQLTREPGAAEDACLDIPRATPPNPEKGILCCRLSTECSPDTPQKPTMLVTRSILR